ncbi:MAG: tryptophan synthase subunit alpha, partial [Pseudomonadota bacterium]
AFRERDALTPVVLMGYLNPVEIRGAAAFAAAAAEAGIDGVLLVDLPPEEALEYRAAFASQGIALISLASPTTPDARLQRLCEESDGYLYYVSFAGVTGADRLHVADAGQRLRQLRSMGRMPVYAGFGIRDADSARAMAEHADGVVVGSALVSALDGSVDAADAAARAGAFLQPLRAALDGLVAAAA